MSNCMITRKGTSVKKHEIIARFTNTSITYTESIEAPKGINYLLAVSAYVWGDAYAYVVLQGSNDNSNWTKILEYSGGANSAKATNGTNNSYKYYRLGGRVARSPNQQYGDQMSASGSIVIL